MVGSGPSNAIARRAVDEIFMFSKETETPKYMKVFISQDIAEARRFIRVQHEEAQVVRSSLAQVRQCFVKDRSKRMIQMNTYDSLRCEESLEGFGEDKLRGLNETITADEDKISTVELHLEIIDAAINSDD
ncbi:hypothetical protein Tco_0487511 [Tanacetum coccineum]